MRNNWFSEQEIDYIRLIGRDTCSESTSWMRNEASSDRALTDTLSRNACLVDGRAFMFPRRINEREIDSPDISRVHAFRPILLPNTISGPTTFFISFLQSLALSAFDQHNKVTRSQTATQQIHRRHQYAPAVLLHRQ